MSKFLSRAKILAVTQLAVYGLLVLCLGTPLFGQGYSLQNFSQFTNGHTLAAAANYSSGDGLTLAKSWYGTGAGDNTNIFAAIQNTTGALTIQNTAACADGDPPGHTGKYLDYSTTLGSGTGNQILFLGWPGSGVSTVSGGEFWFCSTIPVTDVFGTTFDGLQVISAGGSRLSNYTSNGSVQCWNLEGTGVSGGCIPYPTGTMVRVVWQHVSGAACGNTDHSDCIRLLLYNRSGTLLGQNWANLSGAGTPSYATFGNGNAATMSSGHHVQYSDIRMYTQGFSAAQFATLSTFPSQLWDGLITYGRGTDWTQAGIQGGIPSGSWTQCGSTLTTGSYTGAAITTTLSGCAANTYYLLGAGNFTITGQIVVPTKVVIRGNGANSTHLIASGTTTACAQVPALICSQFDTNNYTTSPPAQIYNVTAGLTQGSTSLTLSNVTGIVANSTRITVDGCDTGYSGSTCATGSSVDNSQFFVAGDKYAVTPTGASSSGPDAGGLRPERGEIEMHTVTAVVGSVVTITPPIINPNWGVVNNPQAWLVQPGLNVGVENFSIDMNSGTGAGIEFFNTTNCWLKGVAILNAHNRAFNAFQTQNCNYQDSYIYNVQGTPPSQYGMRLSMSGNNLVQNNILQQVLSPIFMDGSASGDVISYNHIIDDIDPSNTLSPAITFHAENYGELVEGNVVNQITCDDVHGTCGNITLFRNFLNGWDSFPSSPITTFTNADAIWAFGRYTNHLANVLGTTGYHGTYSASANNSAVYWMGGGNGAVSPVVPNDALSKSTSVFFGNYDTVTAANRFCGNSLNTGWGTTCSSTSESAPSASTFPGFVPVYGDTAIGQGALPASLYLSSAPSWFGSHIWPPIGPDVSSGNVGQCAGTINTVGKFNGLPSSDGSKCTGSTLTSPSWGGHVNLIPAMDCTLNTMAIPLDGTGSAGTFNAATCFAGGTPTVATPTFSPVAGAYLTTQSVTISTSTGGATLCYTTDGSTPTANGAGTCTHGTTYSTAVSVASSLTIKAIGSLSGDTDSSVGSAVYVISISPAPGSTLFGYLGNDKNYHIQEGNPPQQLPLTVQLKCQKSKGSVVQGFSALCTIQ